MPARRPAYTSAVGATNSTGVPSLGPLQAESLLEDEAVLLDVREPDEWSAGHAPAARHVPLGELAARSGELPEGVVVVVCRSGGRSAVATAALVAAGRDAFNLVGGMKAWAAAGLPVVTDQGAAGTVI